MATSSDSMWSDYEADFLFAQDRSSEYAERQDALRACLPKYTKLALDIMKATHGDYSLWAKHGLFRAYFEGGGYYSLNPRLLDGKSF